MLSPAPGGLQQLDQGRILPGRHQRVEERSAAVHKHAVAHPDVRAFQRYIGNTGACVYAPGIAARSAVEQQMSDVEVTVVDRVEQRQTLFDVSGRRSQVIVLIMGRYDSVDVRPLIKQIRYDLRVPLGSCLDQRRPDRPRRVGQAFIVVRANAVDFYEALNGVHVAQCRRTPQRVFRAGLEEHAGYSGINGPDLASRHRQLQRAMPLLIASIEVRLRHVLDDRAHQRQAPLLHRRVEKRVAVLVGTGQ